MRHLLVSSFHAKLVSAFTLHCYAVSAVPVFPLLQHLHCWAILVSDLAGKHGNFPFPVNSLLGLRLSCAITGSVTYGWKWLENESKVFPEWGKKKNLNLLESTEAKAHAEPLIPWFKMLEATLQGQAATVKCVPASCLDLPSPEAAWVK